MQHSFEIQNSSMDCRNDERQKKIKHLLFTGTVAVFAILIIAGITTIMIYTPEKKSKITPKSIDLPDNGTLKILDNIANSTDPCNDFETFVCDNVSESTREDLFGSMVRDYKTAIFDLFNQSIRTSDSNSIKIQKNMFKACLDQDAIFNSTSSTLKRVLQDLGGWPVVDNEWKSESFDWVETMYKIRQLGYDYSIFLKLEPGDGQMLRVTIPDIPSIYNNENATFMAAIARFLGAKGDDVGQQMDELYLFIDMLRYNHQNAINLTYEKQSIAQYQRKVRAINWYNFINTIGNFNGQISLNDNVLFPYSFIMANWLMSFSHTSKRTMANYILWRVVEQAFPFIRHGLIRYGFLNMSGNLDEITNQQPEFCLKELLTRFKPNPILIKYTQEHLSKEKREETNKLLSNMKLGVMNVINDTKWIKPKDEKVYFGKLKDTKFVVGMPEYALDSNLFDNMDFDTEQFENNSFFNVLSITNNYYLDWLFDLFKISKLTRTVWGHNFDEIEYYAEGNMINIPPAFLKLFNEARPIYLKYTNIGIILQLLLENILEKDYDTLPSEIRGSLEEKGNCTATTTGVSLEKGKDLLPFLFTQKVLDDVYNKYAKRDGIKLWAPANYTSKQTFWISFYNYSCGEYKQINIVNLIQDFANDFHCKANTEEKCKIF